jgi:hypothetical protein
MNLLGYLTSITIVFVLWIEYSVGNIFYRISGDGTKKFNFLSLLNFMINPFHSSFLWNWETIDLNYLLIIGISILLYYLIEYVQK